MKKFNKIFWPVFWPTLLFVWFFLSLSDHIQKQQKEVSITQQHLEMQFGTKEKK